MPKHPSDKFKNDVDGDFAEYDYIARHTFWTGGKWIVAAVLGVLAIVAMVWGVTVLTAGPKGAGDAYRTNQSGSNRIAKQEMFEQMYADIKTDDANLDTLYAAKVEDPSYVNRTNYTAGVLACNKLVRDYDAEARKYSSEQWRGNDLPDHIDQTDKQFDCKETTK